MDSINNSNCAVCFNCFDTWDHVYATLDILKPTDDKRYYCINEHAYVDPTDVKDCYKKR